MGEGGYELERLTARQLQQVIDGGMSTSVVPFAAYLRHHLALAGREESVFADDANARLYCVANRLPRTLNNAAIAAIIAAADGKNLVDDVCAKKPSRSSPGTDHNQDRPAGTPRPTESRERRAIPDQPRPRGQGPPVAASAEHRRTVAESGASTVESCRLMCKLRGR